MNIRKDLSHKNGEITDEEKSKNREKITYIRN